MRGVLFFAPPYAKHGEGDHSPKSEWWRGPARRNSPSTMSLRAMVPLPILAWRENREERG